MSCFDGFIKEIPNVSVDSFVSYNLMSTTYFLSHAHTGKYYPTTPSDVYYNSFNNNWVICERMQLNLQLILHTYMLNKPSYVNTFKLMLL